MLAARTRWRTWRRQSTVAEYITAFNERMSHATGNSDDDLQFKFMTGLAKDIRTFEALASRQRWTGPWRTSWRKGCQQIPGHLDWHAGCPPTSRRSPAVGALRGGYSPKQKAVQSSTTQLLVCSSGPYINSGLDPPTVRLALFNNGSLPCAQAAPL